jgi:hypothetical protein
MNRKRTILASLAVALPLALGVGIKTVSGSEPPGRLVVNGDGSVTDSVTKLIWQQATNPANTIAGAPGACAALSVGSLTSGWRLPTVKELVSIVDFESATSPMIDTAAFPNTTPTNYFASTPVSASGGLYVVHFGTGVVGTDPSNANFTNIFRCVHASP